MLRYRGLLFSVCRRYSRDGLKVDDLLQETTLALWDLREQLFSITLAPKQAAWIWRVARSTYNGTAYSTVPQPQNASSYWVDLGLPSGLLWAKCNLGASQPEDTGYYFAWGETWPKNEYSWATYAHCVNGDDHSITKYSYSTITGYNGYTDTLRVLEPGDDAATVNIGGGAHTPTYHEWEELWDNCTVEWVTQNGENGLRCTGPNGNSIFLPDHGHFSGNSVGVWGFYWTASAAYNIPCPGDIITTDACSYEVRERG